MRSIAASASSYIKVIDIKIIITKVIIMIRHNDIKVITHDIPYRRKFSRHEKFAKSLKTGFSRLFVRETTPDIRKLSELYSIQRA